MTSTTPVPAIAVRSCLVVPGHQRRMHARALESAADEIVLDLEDAVPVGDKALAREQAVALLHEPTWRERRVAVRINAPGTSENAADIAALANVDHPALSLVVPKVERPGELTVVAAALPGVPLQALVESPRGLLNAPAIADHDAVAALILGYADLAAELGRRPTVECAEDWRVQREAIVTAARAGGIVAIDGPFFRFRDARGLAAAAMTARAAGFDGKWAIHPDQVPVISDAFAAGETELAWAREVLGRLEGKGAASVGGAMVDEAMARRARRLLSLGVTNVAQSRERVGGSVRRVAAPYYNDLSVGQVFVGPGLTISAGHAALHQAIIGDRLRLALDAELSQAVTGRSSALAHPMLVCDIAIGQSTLPSGRVLGNLFYRGLGARPVHVNSTLRTRTEVVALKDASAGRGIAALRVTSSDHTGAPVLDFWRCPLLPARPGPAPSGHADDLAAVGSAADPHEYVPRDWTLSPLREQPLGPLFDELVVGDHFEIEAGDTVTAAPELARLSLNLAMTHTDARTSVYNERLVYGGHVIGIAAAHLTRALPDLATILVWHSCAHLGPTFEGDIVTTRIEVTGLERLRDGGLVELCILASARGLGGLARDVLDFKLVALMP